MRVAACLLVLGLIAAPAGPSQVRSGPAEPVAGAVPAGGGIYRPPVTGTLRIVHPFVPPATRYGPGHRGVDLASRAGTVVVAAGSGTVTFAGSVAGRGVVVVSHPDGVRTEYEPIIPAVSAGMDVVSGQLLGVVSGVHGRCPPNACLHWGARRGSEYFDPLTLLQPLGVVRLLPLAH